MASSAAVTAAFRASGQTGVSARSVHELVVALIVATLFAGLWGVYFGVNAGESYPEPYPTITD